MNELVGSLYDRRWTLPIEGHVGYIESSSGLVLGVQNDSTTSGTNVDIETKKEPISEGQMWIKGKATVNGWFTLTNPNSGKNLQYNVDFASYPVKKQGTIEGTYVLLNSVIQMYV